MRRNSISNPKTPITSILKLNQNSTEDITLLNKKRENPAGLSYRNCLFSQISAQRSIEKKKKRSKIHFATKNTETMLFLREYQDERNWKTSSIENLNRNNERVISLRRNYLMDLKELDSKTRRILLDWLMEVSQLFKFQRETYHSAVVLLDIYLSKINQVVIKEFQLIGITCLLIAAKNEEVIIPSITNFAQTTNFTYISKEILSLEITILTTLNWKIHHPNLGFWLNYLVAKWDIYIEKVAEMPQFFKDELMYKKAFEVIDIISFDYLHLSKDMRILSSVVMYIIIGLKLACFTLKDVRELLLVNENNIEFFQEFNVLFNEFLLRELSIELINFEGHLSYVSSFFCCINEKEQQANEPIDYYNDNDKEKTIRMQDYSKSKAVAFQLIEEQRVEKE